MRYYGGGIGHLRNSPPQPTDPLHSNSDQMDVEEDKEGDTGGDARDELQDIVMNNEELEVDETEEDRSGGNDDDEDDSDNYDYDENNEGGDEDGDEDEDEDEEPTYGSVNDEEDDYGYASP
jgi:hypothetical protein